MYEYEITFFIYTVLYVNDFLYIINNIIRSVFFTVFVNISLPAVHDIWTSKFKLHYCAYTCIDDCTHFVITFHSKCLKQ